MRLACHRCGSKDLILIAVDDEDKAVIWCENCKECTLDGVLKVDVEGLKKDLEMWN